jgi:hypothetical protein
MIELFRGIFQKMQLKKLVRLDKKDRSEFFSNLPINNVPIGALMDFQIYL